MQALYTLLYRGFYITVCRHRLRSPCDISPRNRVLLFLPLPSFFLSFFLFLRPVGRSFLSDNPLSVYFAFQIRRSDSRSRVFIHPGIRSGHFRQIDSPDSFSPRCSSLVSQKRIIIFIVVENVADSFQKREREIRISSDRNSIDTDFNFSSRAPY